MKIFHHLKQGTSFGNLESGSCQEWHCTEIIQQQFLVDFLIIDHCYEILQTTI